MVLRAIPDAWDFADPTDFSSIRAALRRLVPDIERLAMQVNPLLESAVAAGQPIGRALFAANRAVRSLEDTVGRFWQNLYDFKRESQRRLAALTAAGITGSAHSFERRPGRRAQGLLRKSWVVSRTETPHFPA